MVERLSKWIAGLFRARLTAYEELGHSTREEAHDRQIATLVQRVDYLECRTRMLELDLADIVNEARDVLNGAVTRRVHQRDEGEVSRG